jgi:hypothetical protein
MRLTIPIWFVDGRDECDRKPLPVAAAVLAALRAFMGMVRTKGVAWKYPRRRRRFLGDAADGDWGYRYYY